MYTEKVIFTKEEAHNIMKNYLEKVIDFVDGEIKKSTNGVYLSDFTSYQGEYVKRLTRINTKSYFDILKLALEETGYSVNYIKEVNRGDDVVYMCFFDLVSKKGR